MSSRDLAEYQAFSQIEPLGLERVELYLAQLTAAVANGLTPRTDRRAWTIEDFRLDFEPVRPTSTGDLVTAFKGFAARIGAAIRQVGR